MFKSKKLKNIFYKKKIYRINQFYKKTLVFDTSLLEHFAYHYYIYYLSFLKEQESIPYKPLAFVNLQQNRVIGTLKVLHNMKSSLPFLKVFKKPIFINNLKLIFNNKNFFENYKSLNRLIYISDIFKKTKHEILYKYLKFFYFNTIYQVFHGWYFTNEYFFFLKFWKNISKTKFPTARLKFNLLKNRIKRLGFKNRYRLNKLALGFMPKFIQTTEISGHDHHEMVTPLKYSLK